jgi:Flp pilus assembly protein TadG
MKHRIALTATRASGRRRRLPAGLRAFGRNERAATILEFALISAPFFALLIAILETMLTFLAQQGLETAGEAASRLIMTGQAQTSGWTQAEFKTQVCKQLPPFLSCNSLMVDVQNADSFDDADTSSPTISYKNGNVNNAWSYSAGGAGDIVIVRLIYLWPVAAGPLGFNLSNQTGNKHLLVSTSVAQTEPYTS